MIIEKIDLTQEAFIVEDERLRKMAEERRKVVKAAGFEPP
jgi:hypothetical protein